MYALMQGNAVIRMSIASQLMARRFWLNVEQGQAKLAQMQVCSASDVLGICVCTYHDSIRRLDADRFAQYQTVEMFGKSYSGDCRCQHSGSACCT